jgi:uncharacterized protein YjbI with pentapeptide repeats
LKDKFLRKYARAPAAYTYGGQTSAYQSATLAAVDIRNTLVLLAHKTGACMRFESRKPKSSTDVKKLATELTKAVAISVPLFIAGQPGAAMAAGSAAAPSIVDAAMALYKAKGGTLGMRAWSLTSSAFALALAEFFTTVELERRPTGEELKTIVDALLRRAESSVERTSQDLSAEAFTSPLKIPFVRRIAKDLPHELKVFNLGMPPVEVRRLFEDCMYRGLKEVRNLRPDEFSRVEGAVSGLFANHAERRNALSRHHEFLIRGFTQKPLFGQEETGISLQDIYVRQRALWNTKERVKGDESSLEVEAANFFRDESRKGGRWNHPLHIGDLHETMWKWLDNRDENDAIRVVAGGPGSGKSTFARAFALEVIDCDGYDVLFIPLQEIEGSGTFHNRVGALFKLRTDLALNRTENPLEWLGQTEFNGEAPHRPVLLICDGLDEIAPPESAEASNVTADFIQALSNWMNARNSGGHHVSALVLGRTISAQEAFRKLGIAHHGLIRVGGLLPLESSEECAAAAKTSNLRDPDKLYAKDQRAEFWSRWCAAKGISNQLPPALSDDPNTPNAFRELTAEPLLLYLLIWTGFLQDDWEKAADNRNRVYTAIFEQIYQRQWGDKRVSSGANREKGGHNGFRDLSQSDYFNLQEALGLASWQTGGRVVTSESYLATLQIYLEPDQFEDLATDLSTSLKSVALQSYTRSVGGEDAGFEFVHKSIGEYLIARGLVTRFEKSLENVRDRDSDSRCAKAAESMALIFGKGPLTKEIHRFLNDEIRLRFSHKNAESAIDKLVRPTANWILRHGMPVHKQPFPTAAMMEIAGLRALDVFWAGMQSVAALSYASADPTARPITVGSLKLDWPSSHSFLSTYSRLSSPILLAENNRLSNFDFLDLKSQALTDVTLGCAIYAEDGDPLIWLPISLRYVDLRGSQIFLSNLYEAKLTGSDLSDSMLNQAYFASAQLDGVDLTRASLVEANFHHSYLVGANLTEARLQGARFTSARLKNTLFTGATFGGAPAAVFQNSNLHAADLRGVEFNNVVFANNEADGADFRGCKFDDAFVTDDGLYGAILDDGVVLETRPTNELQEHESRMIIMQKVGSEQIVTSIDDLRNSGAPDETALS